MRALLVLLLCVPLSAERWLNLDQAAEEYEGVFTHRLLRSLTQRREIPFSYAGRRIVIAEKDLLEYLDRRRVEPFRPRVVGRRAAS